MVFKNIDVAALPCLGFKGGLKHFSGRIGSMDDAAVTVATFTGEVEIRCRIIVAFPGKGNTFIQQPVNIGGSVLDDQAYHLLITESATGNQRILYMRVE